MKSLDFRIRLGRLEFSGNNAQSGHWRPVRGVVNRVRATNFSWIFFLMDGIRIYARNALYMTDGEASRRKGMSDAGRS